MSFYKNTIKAMSGFGKVPAKPTAAIAADALFSSHPTDHRNKGQVSVANSPLNKTDYFTSAELKAAAADSLAQLEKLS